MIQLPVDIVRVIDADTMDLRIHWDEFGITITERVRLDGVNSPEKNTPEGVEAIAWVNAWLAAREGEPFVLRAPTDRSGHVQREKYGRILGRLCVGDADLNSDLQAAGYAAEYHGGAR